MSESGFWLRHIVRHKSGRFLSVRNPCETVGLFLNATTFPSLSAAEVAVNRCKHPGEYEVLFKDVRESWTRAEAKMEQL